MNVLHLIDADPHGSSPAALRQLAALLGAEAPPAAHRVWLLGGAELGHAADAAGLPVHRRTGAPHRRAWLALPAVARRARQDPRPDAVHCTSPGTLALAATLWPRTPRLLTLHHRPRSGSWLIHTLLQVRAPGRLTLIVPHAPLADALATDGLARDRIAIVPPGVETGGDKGGVSPAPGSRDALRRGWGLDDPRVRTVAMLDDPPGSTSAVTGLLAAGLAAESLAARPGCDLIVRLLVHPRQRHHARAQAMTHDIGRPGRIVQEPALATPWAVLPGCDAAMVLGSVGPGVGWALAAGVPVIAPDDDATRACLGDAADWPLGRPGCARSFAHQIETVLTEPDARARWGEPGRARARRGFDPVPARAAWSRALAAAVRAPGTPHPHAARPAAGA